MGCAPPRRRLFLPVIGNNYNQLNIEERVMVGIFSGKGLFCFGIKKHLKKL